MGGGGGEEYFVGKGRMMGGGWLVEVEGRGVGRMIGVWGRIRERGEGRRERIRGGMK